MHCLYLEGNQNDLGGRTTEYRGVRIAAGSSTLSRKPCGVKEDQAERSLGDLIQDVGLQGGKVVTDGMGHFWWL